MKKIIFMLFLIFTLIPVSVFGMETVDMAFRKNDSGKYIYCNNREFIYPQDLADISNPTPRYIMNNEELGPDKYTIFISHVNHTETRDENNNIVKAGYDVEVDTVFIAREDTLIRLTAVGFQVPENIRYFMGGRTYTEERDWGCFGAWASYLQKTINQKDSGQKYYPVKFEPIEFEIKAGDKVWLSKYISNYTAVPFYRPVHIIADFEILSGLCDVNVAALKSNGNLKDRSGMSANIGFGKYVYDRQYKGISNSKNVVETDLFIKIDDSVMDNTKVPVRIRNRFAPDGVNIVTNWFTHINSSGDIWNKLSGAEDSMLKLEYKDPSKLSYYGKKVKEKDDVWVFDTLHSDTAANPNIKGVRNAYYEPNSVVNEHTDPSLTCNLANYGVFYNYNLTIENTGNTDRYISYVLYTAANNLVLLYDENGNLVENYPLTKGNSNGMKERDVLANIPAPAQKTVNYTLSVVLTTNYEGGMENVLIVNNYPTSVESYDTKRVLDVKDYNFTGKEYVKWYNGSLYTSTNKINWVHSGMNEKTVNLFKGQMGQYKFVYTGDGYLAKSCIYDGSLYSGIKDLFNKVFYLDESFNLVKEIKMYSYAKDVSAAKGLVYVFTDTKYYTPDKGGKWYNLNGANELPVYNMGRFVASYGSKTVNLSTSGANFNPVIFDSFVPQYLQSLGNIYYFVIDNKIYYSYDGVYWNNATAKENINLLGRIGQKLWVNDSEIIDICLDECYTVIRFKDTYLGLKNHPVVIDGSTYVPLRSFAVTSGINLEWNNYNQSAILQKDGNVAEIAEEDGIYINDSLFVPVRKVAEMLGYSVEYYDEYNLVKIF